MLRGCEEKGTLLHCWWECKLVQPLWKTVWRFLKKLEVEVPYDPAIPLLGIHTKETRSERDTCTPVFIAALFITPLLHFQIQQHLAKSYLHCTTQLLSFLSPSSMLKSPCNTLGPPNPPDNPG